MTTCIKYLMMLGLITFTLQTDEESHSSGAGGPVQITFISPRHSHPMTIYLPTPTPSHKPDFVQSYSNSDSFEKGAGGAGQGDYDGDSHGGSQTEFGRESMGDHRAPDSFQSFLYGTFPFSHPGHIF